MPGSLDGFTLVEIMSEVESRLGAEADRGSNRALRIYAHMTHDPVRFLWMCAHDWEGYRARVEELAAEGEQAAIDALEADFPEIAIELSAGGRRKLDAQLQVMDWMAVPEAGSLDPLVALAEPTRDHPSAKPKFPSSVKPEPSWYWVGRVAILFVLIAGGLGGLALLADCTRN